MRSLREHESLSEGAGKASPRPSAAPQPSRSRCRAAVLGLLHFAPPSLIRPAANGSPIQRAASSWHLSGAIDRSPSAVGSLTRPNLQVSSRAPGPVFRNDPRAAECHHLQFWEQEGLRGTVGEPARAPVPQEVKLPSSPSCPCWRVHSLDRHLDTRLGQCSGMTPERGAECGNGDWPMDLGRAARISVFLCRSPSGSVGNQPHSRQARGSLRGNVAARP